jgi:hypothetical protein
MVKVLLGGSGKVFLWQSSVVAAANMVKTISQKDGVKNMMIKVLGGLVASLFDGVWK